MIRAICIILAMICVFQQDADISSAIFWMLVAIFFQMYKMEKTNERR
jgi:hypothetical protein